MERITPVEGKNAPLLLKILNWGSRRWLGQEAIPTKILAHNPGFLLPSLVMSRFGQGKTALPPTIRTLAMHLVAEINGCAWCMDFGQAMGLKPLNYGWAKTEILLGLSAAAGGIKLMMGAGLTALAGGALLVLGGYLALAGSRSHIYLSQNRQTAFLAQLISGIRDEQRNHGQRT